MRDRVRNERSTVPSLLVTSSDAFGHTHRSARRHVTHVCCAVVVSRAHMVRWALRVTPLGQNCLATWQRSAHQPQKATRRGHQAETAAHTTSTDTQGLSLCCCLLCYSVTPLLVYSFTVFSFLFCFIVFFCFHIVSPKFHLFSCILVFHIFSYLSFLIFKN